MRRKLVFRSLLVLLSTVTVVPDAFSMLSGRYCDQWADRAIRYPALSAADLYRASGGVQEAEVAWLPASFHGLAAPGLVLYAGEADAAIWLHEMTHQAQMDRDGLPRFALNYGWDWVQGRYHGCGPLDAYQAVRYEREAYAVAATNQGHMQDLYERGSSAAMRTELRYMGTASLRPRGLLERLGELFAQAGRPEPDPAHPDREHEAPPSVRSLLAALAVAAR